MFAVAERDTRSRKIDPVHPGDPGIMHIFDLNGREGDSGVPVTEATAVSGTAFLQGVRLISENMGMLPFLVYRRKEGSESGKERVRDHPLARIFRLGPNEDMTAHEFKERLFAQAIVYGRGVAYVEREKSGPQMGQVREMTLLNATRLRREKKGDRLWWMYDHPDGQTDVLRPDQVFMLNGFNLSGMKGLNLIDVGREALGHDLALRKYGSSFFKNGALQRGFIRLKGSFRTPGRREEVERQIREATEGIDRAHKIMVLNEEAEWVNTGVEPEHAQWIMARKFSVTELARLLNIKPHLLMDLERATFSNIGEQGEEHVRYTLGAWGNRFEERFDKDLVVGREQDEIFGEFLMEFLLKGDTTKRYEAYNIGIQAGFLTRNEVRDRENLNPIDGLDEPLQPLNMVTAGDEGETPDGDAGTVGGEEGRTRAYTDLHGPTRTGMDGDGQAEAGRSALAEASGLMEELAGADATGEEEHRRDAYAPLERRAASRKTLREAHRSSFRAAAERIVKREVREIRKKLKMLADVPVNPNAPVKEAGDQSRSSDAPTDVLLTAGRGLQSRPSGDDAYERRDVGQFLAWLEEYYADFPEAIVREMTPAVRALMNSVAAQVAGELGIDDIADMEDAMRSFVEQFSERYAGSSAGQIRQLIREGALADGIHERLGEWLEKRADKIAMRDTVQAEGYAAREAMRAGGVTKFRWVAVGKSCPICNELDGKVVGVEESFARAGDVINPNMAGQPRDADVPISLKVSGNVFHPPLHDGCDCVVVAE